MSNPLLAIDAGNSRLKFGLFVPSNNPLSSLSRPINSETVESPATFPDCCRFLAIPVSDPIPWTTLSGWQPAGAVIAGSNPSAIDRVLEGWGQTNLPLPLVIRDRSSLSIELDVDFPEKVGIDRLLNAVAANALRPANKPVIIVDSGTATTVNYLSSSGIFCGGAILPGLEMSAKALNHYTAVLPQIPVQDLGGTVPAAPGRNTREAIRSGLFWGQVGAIRELIHQICKQQDLIQPIHGNRQPEVNSPWLILTGGGAPVLSSQFPDVLSIQSLGMHGLILTAWNQGN